MLKGIESLKTIEHKAEEQLRAVLQAVPSVVVSAASSEGLPQDSRTDLRVHLLAHGRPYDLICEILNNGQPRHVQVAALRLRHGLLQYASNVSAAVIAPYLSPAAQSICRDHEVNFLDLEGNCRLVFDDVFIERLVPTKPPAERRELRAIFAPKSAQLLRVMMRNPHRAWRIAKLAGEAGVSLGHASNLRSALLDRGWAEVGPDGLRLTKPEDLLESWRQSYQPPAGKRLKFYTVLHGKELQEAIKNALPEANEGGAAMLASFSAAQWLAPYARTGSQFFYADLAGLESLQSHLRLSSAVKGENVVVICPNDLGIFRDRIEPAPGISCTSPVQTYLDLAIAGERGQEAAEHLKAEKLTWHR